MILTRVKKFAIGVAAGVVLACLVIGLGLFFFGGRAKDRESIFDDDVTLKLAGKGKGVALLKGGDNQNKNAENKSDNNYINGNEDTTSGTDKDFDGKSNGATGSGRGDGFDDFTSSDDSSLEYRNKSGDDVENGNDEISEASKRDKYGNDASWKEIMEQEAKEKETKRSEKERLEKERLEKEREEAKQADEKRRQDEERKRLGVENQISIASNDGSGRLEEEKQKKLLEEKKKQEELAKRRAEEEKQKKLLEEKKKQEE